MTKLIKEILKIINQQSSNNKLTINFWGDEIWFDIYETEIPIIVNVKTKEVYMDCEGIDHHITGDMMSELTDIIMLIADSIDELEDCI